MKHQLCSEQKVQTENTVKKLLGKAGKGRANLLCFEAEKNGRETIVTGSKNGDPCYIMVEKVVNLWPMIFTYLEKDGFQVVWLNCQLTHLVKYDKVQQKRQLILKK